MVGEDVTFVANINNNVTTACTVGCLFCNFKDPAHEFEPRVHDRDALEGVLDYLDAIHRFPPTGEKSVLLQVYLPEATDIRVMVIDGTAVGAVERHGPGWKHNVHRDAAVRSVPVDGEIARVAETVARTLAIDYVGVDLLVSDGVVYCSETNARPTIDDPALYAGDLFARLIALIRRVAD